jgi:hypothetical protein
MGSQRSELQSFLTNLPIFIFNFLIFWFKPGRGIFLLQNIPNVLSHFCNLVYTDQNYKTSQ